MSLKSMGLVQVRRNKRYRITAPELQKAKAALKTVRRGEVARIATRVVKRNDEKKYLDTALNGVQFYNAGIIQDLSIIPQGDAQSQRNGDKVTYTGLEMRCTLYYGALSDSTIRVVIFKHRQNSFNFTPTAVSPVVPGGFASTALAPHFPYDWPNRKNYKILYDSGPIVAVNASNGGTLTIRKKIRVKGKIDFNPGAVSGTNKIFILFFTDTILANQATVYGDWRLFYTDA